MIYLGTGLPGDGKTLNTLDDLLKRLDNDEKETGVRPQVYFCNLLHFSQKDFEEGKCSQSAVGKAFDPEHELYENVVDWIEVTKQDVTDYLWSLYDDEHPVIKHGSIIFIDECQDLYPMRPKGSVPEYLKFFEKHRHTGCDFYLITQKIRQVDVHLRELVNEHKEYKRIMGRDFVRVKTLSRIMDGKDLESDEIQTSQKTYNKKLFNLYKSSTKHTHKKKLSKKLTVLMPLIFVFIGAMFYLLYTVLFSHDDEIQSMDSVSVSNSASSSFVAPSRVSSASNITFDDSFFVVSEIEYNGRIITGFVQYLDEEKKRYIQWNLDELLALGFDVRRIHPFLYLMNGSYVSKMPKLDFPHDYACCESSGKRQHNGNDKENNGGFFHPPEGEGGAKG